MVRNQFWLLAIKSSCSWMKCVYPCRFVVVEIVDYSVIDLDLVLD